jgi:hypothetical protein
LNTILCLRKEEASNGSNVNLATLSSLSAGAWEAKVVWTSNNNQVNPSITGADSTQESIPSPATAVEFGIYILSSGTSLTLSANTDGGANKSVSGWFTVTKVTT